MICIVIPYYKLSFFEETLQSLANQTDKRFNVYIGDDASPEDPTKLLEQYKGLFNFTYKKFEVNLGGTSLTKQWERCIDLIKDEDWFMILGDDDYLEVDCVKGFYQLMAKPDNNFKVLRFKIQVVDERIHKTSPVIVFKDGEKSSDFIVKKAMGLVRNSLSEYVFRIEDYKNYGIIDYPKAFYSDNMMVLMYSGFGAIKNIPLGNVFIRISYESLTGNKENTKDLAFAGYLFYTDLLKKYKNKFSKFQKSYFLIQIFDFLLIRKSISNFLSVFTLIYTNSSLKLTWKYLILFLKNIVQKSLSKSFLVKKIEK